MLAFSWSWYWLCTIVLTDQVLRKLQPMWILYRADEVMCSYLLCVLNDCLSWLVTYCSKPVVASQISAQLKRSTQWKSEFSIDSAIIKVGTKVAWIDVLMVGVLHYAMSVWSVCWVDWENLQQETASIRDKFAAWGDLLVGQREECCIVDLSLSDWYALASYLLGIPWHWEQTEPSTVLHLMSALKKTLKNPKNTGSKRNLSVQMPWRHF